MRRHPAWQLAVVLAATFAAAAPAETWRSLGPDGGSVTSLAVDPRDGRVLLAGSFGGLFRSANSGHSWQPFGAGLAAPALDLAFHPLSPSTGFAATPGGLFRSVDGGLTWVPSAEGAPAGIYAYAVRPIAGQRGVVLALGMVSPLPLPIPNLASFYVLRSTDGGRSWRVQNAGLPAGVPLNDLRPDPFRADLVYLGTASGLYRSRDGGRTWRRISLAGKYVSRIAVDSLRAGRLWALAAPDDSGQRAQVLLSTDGGFGWQDRTPDRHPGAFALVAGDPARRDHLYLGTPSGLLLSGDAGRTWRRVFNGWVTSLAGDRRSGTLTAGGGGYGVARSQNGVVWVTFKQGLRARAVDTVAPGGGDALWAASATLFVSPDDGGTWTPTSAEVGAALVADPTSPLIAYAGAAQGLIRTHDGGTSWEFAGPPGTENGAAPVFALVPDPSSSSGLFLLDTTAVWHSADGADSWQLLTRFDATRPRPQMLAVSLGTPPVLFIDAPYQIYGHPGDIVLRSTDNGATWTNLPLIVPGRATAVVVDPADPQRLWIAHSRFDYVTGATGGVSRSFDGGATWETALVDASAARVTGLLLDPRDSDVLYAAATSGVFVSRDAGSTWQPLSTGLRAAGAASLALRRGTPDTLYAATAGGVYALTLP
ncbi:MAG: WD40/YVTN/BNR-like repeat-containing protein [Acidobacteriota bacterium]